MLIDHDLPHYDVTEVQGAQVTATPELTYSVIRDGRLRSMINALCSIANDRPASSTGGVTTLHPATCTFNDLATAELGWMPLGEEPDVDDTARVPFRRYWRIIHPGVTIVTRRALQRIRVEAERRQAGRLGAT